MSFGCRYASLLLIRWCLSASCISTVSDCCTSSRGYLLSPFGLCFQVSSPQQFDDLVAAHPDKLIVLMCKSYSCRPCKMFTRKYLAMVSLLPSWARRSCHMAQPFCAVVFIMQDKVQPSVCCWQRAGLHTVACLHLPSATQYTLHHWQACNSHGSLLLRDAA